MKQSQLNIYSSSESGHRKDYIDFVSKLFNVRRVSGWKLISSGSAVLFLMIEESFVKYLFVSVFRALLGRKTIGFLFRPKQAAEGKTFKLILKRYLLKFLKRVELIHTISIVPFSVAPNLEIVADTWIYDLQLWDVRSQENLKTNKDQNLTQFISNKSDTRLTIVAIGAQNKEKGFEEFAQTWIDNDEIRKRYFFMFGGKLNPSFQAISREFLNAGGVGFDRFITDAELHSFYAKCDAVWCLYDPDYDQASGILGRAVQYGIPAIVREGSLSHRLCEIEGAVHIPATKETISEYLLDKPLSKVDPLRGERLAQKFRQRSVMVLSLATGLEARFK